MNREDMDWARGIHGYLADNQTQAFTAGDLIIRVISRIMDKPTPPDNSVVERALKALLRTGAAKSKVVNGVKYYSYGSGLKL